MTEDPADPPVARGAGGAGADRAGRDEHPAPSATAATATPATPATPATVVEAGTTPEARLGAPGRPFERHSPFYVGLVGGLGLLAAFVLGRALVSLSSVLVLVVVSMFLAAGLNPVVEWLERRDMRRGVALLVVISAVLCVIGLFVVAIVPVIADQVAAITASAPDWLDRLQANDRVQQLDDEYQIIANLRDYVANGDFLAPVFGGVLGFGLRVLSTLFNVFIVVVLTLYFLSSLHRTKAALYRLVPASRRDRVGRLGDRVVADVGGYVSGAFVVAVTAGVVSLVFLVVVGLGEYAVALAFVVALLDVIPMIGATLGAVVVSAIGFATDVQTGVVCVIFFLVYQQIENYVVYPRVMARSVDIPGAVAVIAALAGATLLGVVGALLAIPTAAAIMLVLREVVQPRQDAR